MLILKDPFEDDELLATSVSVGGKMAFWCVSDDRRGTRDLAPKTIKHAPLHAGNWRWHPGKTRRVNDSPLRKVCVEFHGHLLIAQRLGFRKLARC